MFALEGPDVAHGNVELVGDPCIGAPLAHPRADLVQLGLQRSACQTAPETSNGWPLNPPGMLALLGPIIPSAGETDGRARSYAKEQSEHHDRRRHRDIGARGH